jgi:hypothetical protein
MGFAITFAMFFDDSVAEAVAMWIIEAMAISCEFVVYRTKAKMYNEEIAKLTKTDKELEELKKNRKEIKRLSRHGSQSSMPFTISPDDDDDDDDDDSFSGHSFGSSSDDNDDDGENNKKAPTAKKAAITSNRKLTTERTARNVKPPLTRARSFDRLGMSGHESFASIEMQPVERKEMRLLRERRILREKQQEEQRDLRMHLVGTVINISLIIISLILIIAISSTGGLCINNGSVKIFSMDQLGKCNRCVGATDGDCQVCNSDGSHQCYYPYY